MRGKKGRQGRLGRGERRELDERTGCKFKEVARGVRGANLLEDLGTVGWVGRHEGGANGVALAVASSAGTTLRVRSGVFLGGSTTHDDADDATKKSVALPEGRGGVGGGHVGRTGIMRHHTTLPTTAHHAPPRHTFLRRNSLRPLHVYARNEEQGW